MKSESVSKKESHEEIDNEERLSERYQEGSRAGQEGRVRKKGHGAG